jgi:4a-hydroxytetrahydrobiopterin dehydratase
LSEKGWRAFLAAEGLEDWAVLHGGPTAVFRTETIIDAAKLAQAIAQLPGLNPTYAQMTIVSERLTVRLRREVWEIANEDIDLAKEISKIAQAQGALADPSQVQEVQVAISAKPKAIDLNFWRTVLGYQSLAEDNAMDPLGNSSTVWMQELDEGKALRHAMHLDVSVSREHVEARVAAAIKAGGVIVDDSHAPSFWILADSSGNKVCLVAWPDGAVDPKNA